MTLASSVVLCAGLLHFLQVPALLLPSPVRDEVNLLFGFVRSLVRVLLLGIVITVLGIGIIVVVYAEEMVASPLGGALLCWCCVFWGFRFVAQLTILRRQWLSASRSSFYVHAAVYGVKLALYGTGLVLRGW